MAATLTGNRPRYTGHPNRKADEALQSILHCIREAGVEFHHTGNSDALWNACDEIEEIIYATRPDLKDGV